MSIGSYAICNLMGIIIEGVDYGIDDYVCFRYANGNDIGRLNRSKVRYTSKGRAYFMSYGRRIYLDEVMRTA